MRTLFLLFDVTIKLQSYPYVFKVTNIKSLIVDCHVIDLYLLTNQSFIHKELSSSFENYNIKT